MKRTWKQAFQVAALSFAAVGCNSQPSPVDRGILDNNAVETVSTNKTGTKKLAAKPDASKVTYDADSSTLNLYDLPESGARWMVSLPNESKAVPVPKVYKLPKKLDPRFVNVYYTVPNGGASGQITLQEVMELESQRMAQRH